ncbi:MAG: hypothetical protein QM742_02740 [Aquabacterium sp.]
MKPWERSARRWLGAVALLVGAALLPGCAVQHTAKVPGRENVGVDQGVVLLSVTSNSPRSGQFDSVTLERETPSGRMAERYRLDQVSKGLARDTALFVGAVPPGRYKVVRFAVGELYIALGEASIARIGTFDVKAGATQDLGRLIVTNLNAGVLVGRSELVKSNVDLVRRFVPEAAKHVARIDGAGWASARDARDKTEEFALGTPAGAASLTELPDGEVVAASRLGSILLRDSEGRWRRIGIGGLESLLWLKRVDQPDARLVAVGEFNTIVQLGRDWHVTRLKPGNLPPGNLIFVDGSEREGWFLAQQAGPSVTIYRSQTLDGGDWKPIRVVHVGDSFWFGTSQFWIWPTSGGFAYAVSKGEIHWFNMQSGAWVQTQAPDGRRIAGVQHNPGDALGLVSKPAMGLDGPLFARVHVSTDKGAVWQSIDSPFRVNVHSPVRLPSGALLLHGGQPASNELYRSDGVGAPWKRVDQDIAFTEQLVALPTKGVFSIDEGNSLSGYASIRHSADEGRTWQLEYSNRVDLKK